MTLLSESRNGNGGVPASTTRAVILAGGRGTRLAPFTSVLPKPLMPVGERAILELVVEQLSDCGIRDITLCVGYLSHLIRAVFDVQQRDDISIRYVQEEDALGTAGPLRLVDGLDETFIVMNGDVLTTLDYADLLAYHRDSGNALTIATRDRSIKIDYGVLHLDGDANPVISDYSEKPELVSTVSMGIYVLEPWVLEYVPEGRAFDVPDLVQVLLRDGKRLGAYRYEGLWFDIGRREDYEEAVATWLDSNGNAKGANGNGNGHAAADALAADAHVNGNGHADGNGHANGNGSPRSTLAVALAAQAVRQRARSQGRMDDDLRETLSGVPSPVTIVTSLVDDRAHATTVSSFTSLSAEPPLVMLALDRSSDLLALLVRGSRFGVNLLAAGQAEIGRACATKGGDKLARIPWTDVDGVARIDGAAALVMCEVEDLLPGGDHVIVVGRVTSCESAKETAPLVYHRRRFCDLSNQP